MKNSKIERIDKMEKRTVYVYSMQIERERERKRGKGKGGGGGGGGGRRREQDLYRRHDKDSKMKLGNCVSEHKICQCKIWSSLIEDL